MYLPSRAAFERPAEDESFVCNFITMRLDVIFFLLFRARVGRAAPSSELIVFTKFGKFSHFVFSKRVSVPLDEAARSCHTDRWRFSHPGQPFPPAPLCVTEMVSLAVSSGSFFFPSATSALLLIRHRFLLRQM